jgi:hypothetical protein
MGDKRLWADVESEEVETVWGFGFQRRSMGQNPTINTIEPGNFPRVRAQIEGVKCRGMLLSIFETNRIKLVSSDGAHVRARSGETT